MNLDYTGTQIHQNYNERVRALERAILQGGGGGAMPVAAPARGGSDAVPVSGPVVSPE